MTRVWVSLAVACAVLGSAAASASGPLRIGLVLEQPLVGRGDDPFQHGEYVGLKRAIAQLHVEGRVVAPRPNGSYLPPLLYLARQGYDLVMASGFAETSDLSVAARRFPAVKFALLDARRTDVPHAPRNVEGTVFHSEEPSYLAGYLAAKMVDRRPGPHVVSTVAGVPIPPVQAYIAGFQAGAKAADPAIKTLNNYSYDFVNKSKCEQAAKVQVARGSRAIFDVAGGCGLGALSVAKQSGIWAVGVDIDQSYLGPFVLTSVVKHLDVAVFEFARQLSTGRFATGGDKVFDLRSGGVGLGPFSPRVPRALRLRLAELAKQIVSGRIRVPTTFR